MGLDPSDSESSSFETDVSDSESDGSSDTDRGTEEEDFGFIKKKPVRAKQEGGAVYIYMYIVYMLLAKACQHNRFV